MTNSKINIHRINLNVLEWMNTPGMTRESLEENLLPLLNGDSELAETVAVTAVTWHHTQRTYEDYAHAGVQMPPMTQNGAELFGPPAHRRCRCWTKVVRLPDNSWVIVWSTNRDDLVCRESLAVPWGKVMGCRDLHNRIISDGMYLGLTLDEAHAEAKNHLPKKR